MSDRRSSPGGHSGEEGADSPSGAVAITTVVAVVILLSWFGVFVLNLVRG